MWIKICGTTNLEDATTALNAGADAIGFVLAPSKRQVTPHQVATITAALPPDLETVGVFTSTDATEILATVNLAHLTAVQLHSAFNPTLIAALKAAKPTLRILQVLGCEAENRPAAKHAFEGALRSILASQQVDAILLDTAIRGTSGGTGITFDWSTTADTLRKVWPASSACKLIIAGGLNPQNIAQAIRQLQPHGVDVVTGVEASPGKKDPDRIHAFLAAART